MTLLPPQLVRRHPPAPWSVKLSIFAAIVQTIMGAGIIIGAIILLLRESL